MDDFSDENLWKRDEVDSPCVKICVIHPAARLCVGCNRSIEEIATWSRMDSVERRRIIAELPARGALMTKRRGGRGGRSGRLAGD